MVWCSGVAKTQSMPVHNVGTPCLWELLCKTQRKVGGYEGMLPYNIFDIWSSPGQFLGYFRSYARLESDALLTMCVQCKVTLLLAANSCAVRAGEHTRPRYSEDTNSYILCCSISRPSYIFSAWFVVYNSTFGTDNFYMCTFKWWARLLIVRPCAPVVPTWLCHCSGDSWGVHVWCKNWTVQQVCSDWKHM